MLPRVRDAVNQRKMHTIQDLLDDAVDALEAVAADIKKLKRGLMGVGNSGDEHAKRKQR
jgi:hypothetical protein